jgi:porin
MRNAFIATIVLTVITSTVHATESFEQQPSLSIEATYTGESWRLTGPFTHGDGRSHFAYLDNLDVTATLDGEALFGIGGLQLFAYALYDNGHAVNEGIVDTVQGISNIEAPRALRMYEAWAQWQLGLVSLRAGLYDLNSEFDAIENAGLFINPSHGIGPDFSQSGLNGPSIFPVTSLGVRMQIEVGQWQARFAVLDAVPGDPEHSTRTSVQWNSDEGALYVVEVNHRLASDVRTGVGYWQYSEAFEHLAQTDAEGAAITQANNRGAYVFVESAAIPLASVGGSLHAFTRAGWANEDLNPIARYAGAGVTWTGFVSGRADDQIGIAFGHAVMSDAWRTAQSASSLATRASESILELTARLPIGERFVVQPDVQYIHHPGADASKSTAWAFGLRCELGFSYSR